MLRLNVPVEIFGTAAQPKSLLRLKFVQNAILFIPAKKRSLIVWEGWKNFVSAWPKRKKRERNVKHKVQKAKPQLKTKSLNFYTTALIFAL